ncbi:hypothetical protein GOBAR_DD12132 [Gossypium barbadense]|nr:hypothetical protein GOBAR_DD12132 [Gossypium barbadense]
MATTSPPPQSSPPAPSPASATSPPPSTPPPANAIPPPSQSQSPPPDVSTAPPPLTLPSPPPPQTPSPPPPTPSTQPPVPSPPPPAPPPRLPPPVSSPPPSSQPPLSTPPPSQPPLSTPPPSRSPPPNPPPPPSQTPPTEPPNSPPPPSSISPAPTSPSKRTPPSSQPTPSPSNSTPSSSPPPSISRLSPPPPPQVLTPPTDNRTVNAPGPSAPESSDSGNDGIGVGGAVAIGVAVGIIVLSLIGLAVWCLRRQKKTKLTRVNGGYVMPSPLGSSPRSVALGTVGKFLDLHVIGGNVLIVVINMLIDSSPTKTHSSAPLIGSSSGSDFVHSPPMMPEPGGLGNSKTWFTYEELTIATNGFSDQNLLGEGGFGAVYKGCLPDGREVAVKQLKIGGGQGEREFKAEVAIISRIHHRHLVSLVGYCISENRRLLIYDYVPNNTLYFHLHREGMPVLDWATRLKIAAGAARGIAYLHEDCKDIKSSNILLDNNFEAQVSDFGLAKLALDANTHVTTRVMGTFGYMAPEYASSGKLTEKSDVFSFGVVLLELITGRKPVDASQPLGDESLVEWARPLLSHALDSEDFGYLADPKLGGIYVESEMFRMIEAATACVRHSAAKRPRMGQIVRAFESLATSDLSNGMKVGESEIILAKVALAGVVEEEYDRVLTRDEAEQLQSCMDANLNCLFLPWTTILIAMEMEECNMLAADCIVICCCSQCLILQIIIFVFLKFPAKLIKKTKQYAKKKLIGRRRKEGKMKDGLFQEVQLEVVTKSCMSMSIELRQAGFGDAQYGVQCCCIQEAEKVLEELSSRGEFAFGSFWGRSLHSDTSSSPSCHLPNGRFDFVECYELVDMSSFISAAATC